MVTIRKIAERCGVSTATVSKALNHAPDIGEDTAQRVRKTAQEMGYFPNAAARSLKTRHTRNLGVITSLRIANGMSHDFIARLISFIQNTAEENGYDITLLSNQMAGMNFMEHCRYRNFDGVALVCCGFAREDVQEVLHGEIPCVCVDYQTPGYGNVMTDTRLALDQLVGYVYDQGHRRLAYIHGEDSYITQERMAAFRQACAARSLTVPEEAIRMAYYNYPAGAAEATRSLLRLAARPTCIFYQDDYAATGGLDALAAEGLRVPEDVSVVAYDGISLSSLLTPPLTTYWQDAETIGREATIMLLSAVEAPETYQPRHLLVPGRLLTGGTVRRLII